MQGPVVLGFSTSWDKIQEFHARKDSICLERVKWLAKILCLNGTKASETLCKLFDNEGTVGKLPVQQNSIHIFISCHFFGCLNKIITHSLASAHKTDILYLH